MNVIDKYQNLSVEEIRSDFSNKKFPFATFMCNIEGDFNISTMIRNSNAFAAEKVYYFGRRKFDRRGTVGTHKYLDIVHLTEPEQILELKNKYHFVALDILPGRTKPMRHYKWKENTLMLFGEEKTGLPEWILEICDDIVEITQYGTVRSLNVGSASCGAMIDFTTKYLNSKEL